MVLESWSGVTLIPKPDKGIRRKENYRPIILINTDTKIFTKISRNNIQQNVEVITHHDYVEFIPQVQCKFNIQIRSKIRMSDQFYLVLYQRFQSEKLGRKEKINIQIGKKDINLSLFADEIILYIENLRESTKNIL